jgi:hypothetical protein
MNFISEVICPNNVILDRFLHLVDDYSLFIGLSFTLRVLEAVGTSAIYVIVYSFVGKEFSTEYIGSVFVRNDYHLFILELE